MIFEWPFTTHLLDLAAALALGVDLRDHAQAGIEVVRVDSVDSRGSLEGCVYPYLRVEHHNLRALAPGGGELQISTVDIWSSPVDTDIHK